MLEINDVLAISVDIQEKLVPVMHNKEELVDKTTRLIKGLETLNIPILVARQYPQGLGDTIKEIRDIIPNNVPYDKKAFGCMNDADFVKGLESYPQKKIIVFGIEAHVCVLQTVLGLVEANYEVILVSDAISSRYENDKAIAITRAQQVGVTITSVESLLFELIKSSKHPNFKEISNIIK